MIVYVQRHKIIYNRIGCFYCYKICKILIYTDWDDTPAKFCYENKSN